MRGLLVDFGGVLTTNVFQSFKQFAEAEGLDRDAIKRAFKEDREALALLRQLEKNEITVEDFEPRFAERIGVPDDRVDGLVERLFAGVGPEERMLDAVRRARAAGVRTGLISNSWGEGLSYDDDMLEELFDAVVISGDVGMHRPDPAIFRLGAERVGVPPEECAFVDDLGGNLKPAKAIGMATIRHTSADETIPQLEELLGVSLR